MLSSSLCSLETVNLGNEQVTYCKLDSNHQHAQVFNQTSVNYSSSIKKLRIYKYYHVSFTFTMNSLMLI